MSETNEQELQSVTDGKRIFSLDALRGIAALSVVFYHFRCAYTTRSYSWYERPFMSGHQAVVLFFVLSGYVLSLPYWRGKQMSYGRYLVRRIFRIYGPYFFALVLAVLFASRLSFSHLNLTPWFQQTWQSPLTHKLLLQHLVMLGGKEINGAFWSLRYEMQMSIIFPAICWVMTRLAGKWNLLLSVALAGVGTVTGSASILWASCFILGAFLAQQNLAIRRLFRPLPLVVKLILAAVTLTAYVTTNDLLVIVGSVGLMIFAQHSRFADLLQTPLPEYLGKVSYSLYLTHGTVLFATLVLLYGKIPLWSLALILIAATASVAHAFWYCIESPLIHFGRRITAKPSIIRP